MQLLLRGRSLVETSTKPLPNFYPCHEKFNQKCFNASFFFEHSMRYISLEPRFGHISYIALPLQPVAQLFPQSVTIGKTWPGRIRRWSNFLWLEISISLSCIRRYRHLTNCANLQIKNDIALKFSKSGALMIKSVGGSKVWGSSKVIKLTLKMLALSKWHLIRTTWKRFPLLLFRCWISFHFFQSAFTSLRW